jgi:hypothetical protein
MAGRNASARPAERRRANRRQHQRKPKPEPVAAVSRSKTERDVVKLIECLAEWTRDLQAERSAALKVPSRRRSRSRARRVSTVSLPPSYPRGNPLTESMEFTDRDGAVWLAYIEGGAQPRPEPQPTAATVLPERHLRFDSATESRFTASLPAGSPFLAEARLQSLLDGAQYHPPLASTTGSPAQALSGAEHRVARWTRAVESGREAITDWPRRWRQTASRRQTPRRYVRELLSGAAHTMHAMVEVLLGHRPARS